MKKIVLLVDFTGVCLLAMDHIAIIARQSLCRVILLHVASAESQDNAKLIEQEIRDFAEPLEKEGVPFSIHIKFGNFFDIISAETSELDPDLLVVGTHGFKGIKKNFQSSNILNLLRLIRVPSLIIQGHTDTPHDGYNSVLLPLIPSDEKVDWVPVVQGFAGIFNSEVRVLSHHNSTNKAEVEKETEAMVAKLTENQSFQAVIDLEETSQYTSAYSRSIIEYSDIEENDVIVLILGERQNNYFNIDDQENILLNRLGKPILCI